jgi:predicted molibdopterin-dependent oxidoreductase YjgC
MFRRRDPGSIVFQFDGKEVCAREGDSVAAALLAAGERVTRLTPVGQAPRGPFCMMGACFECLAEVDGVPGVQTCLVPARAGMRVARQIGAAAADAEPE